MDRAALERLTVEQLRREAAKYRLPSTGRKIDLIETIIAYFDAHGPVADLLGTTPGQEDDGEEAGETGRLAGADGCPSPDVGSAAGRYSTAGRGAEALLREAAATVWPAAGSPRHAEVHRCDGDERRFR